MVSKKLSKKKFIKYSPFYNNNNSSTDQKTLFSSSEEENNNNKLPVEICKSIEAPLSPISVHNKLQAKVPLVQSNIVKTPIAPPKNADKVINETKTSSLFDLKLSPKSPKLTKSTLPNLKFISNSQTPKPNRRTPLINESNFCRSIGANLNLVHELEEDIRRKSLDNVEEVRWFWVGVSCLQVKFGEEMNSNLLFHCWQQATQPN